MVSPDLIIRWEARPDIPGNTYEAIHSDFHLVVQREAPGAPRFEVRINGVSVGLCSTPRGAMDHARSMLIQKINQSRLAGV